MSQPYAAGSSSSKPLPGQDNRSGPNFQFVSVPTSGNLTASFTSSSSSSIDCTIMQDVSGGRDPIIATIRDGATVAASKFKTGTNYYLASPNGPGSTNFAVTLGG